MTKETDMYTKHRELLYEKINRGEHLIGIAAGNGISAKYSVMAGCDIMLALSSGVFRSAGCGSLAGYLCYANSNDLVMNFARKELLRYRDSVPVFFGLNASDPTRDMHSYIKEIQAAGFTGIVNYPTVGMIDGKFREYLEEGGISYEQEAEAIRFAHYCGMLTVAYVFSPEQARLMAKSGADIICAHFGLTGGGYAGPKHVLNLESARLTADAIFKAVEGQAYRGRFIKMVYGGPVMSPVDAEYLYRSCGCQGYIGGSVFERTPVESAILGTVRSFKADSEIIPASKVEKLLFGGLGQYNYVEFIQEYIRENYADDIRLSKLAESMHLSTAYLSTLFSREVGMTFKSYLVKYRMERARELIRSREYPLVQVAQMVGYLDYTHFSKMYKKMYGVSPSED